MLDLNKRVYNHTPGPCRVVTGITDGAAGLELVSEVGIVFISTGLANAYVNETIRGGLAMFQLEKEMAKHETKPVKIEGEKFDQNKFAPLGISSYYSKGRILLYVVNSHPERQCVEIFTYHKDKNVLFHRKSVCDARFTSIYDVVVVGADRFFISNLAYMSRGKLQTVELVMQSSFGALYFFDGRTVSLHESRLSTPSALAIDRQRRLIFVGSLLNENVRVYALEKDYSLTFRTQISLLSSPAGIHIEEETGDIWIALHPVLHQAYLVTLYPSDENVRSSSQVLREDGVSWVITEPYANDGATISASNAVVYDKDHLLIGSMFGRLLHCDVLNPSIT
ncbi:Arylesterase [Ancylostoma duodenale]|uniref:Paraoxonase n=1 Tax=Ancylostoma duodenale TaxID=51022 RepID=A0A0C2CLG2_9BILA|nr:Arylesterase [Ancylostoma duodenale]